ncbi:hypothetical protein EYF80_015805 [Liparis tanakae]|uniref:Uncharacterized protein n=1 Tax=Liparis tanakae TaxID=230148 RepID=A0A4Z2I9D9_9TELE|nr:hypothetical protein EYF80_015805 [Liparis tanakae]
MERKAREEEVDLTIRDLYAASTVTLWFCRKSGGQEENSVGIRGGCRGERDTGICRYTSRVTVGGGEGRRGEERMRGRNGGKERLSVKDTGVRKDKQGGRERGEIHKEGNLQKDVQLLSELLGTLTH